MTGKNPVLITRAPDDFIIEYDGESASRSPWHEKEYQQKDIVDRLLKRMKQKRLDAIMKDEKKNWREEVQLCKICAYTNWIGGQAFTTTTCKKCGKEMEFPSTVVDTYCIDCAKELGVCKMCGKPMD